MNDDYAPVEQATAAPGEKRELPPIERVQAMRLEPGDTVIVTVPAHVTAVEIETLKGHMEELFPGHQIIVVGGGLELGVISGE
jgi:hypothetical protein